MKSESVINLHPARDGTYRNLPPRFRSHPLPLNLHSFPDSALHLCSPSIRSPPPRLHLGLPLVTDYSRVSLLAQSPISQELDLVRLKQRGRRDRNHVYQNQHRSCFLESFSFLKISALYAFEYRVGFITFDMSFSANGSNIKGNLTELGQIVAKELKVDKSQVHLLNFTSRGGDHVVRWGIFPAAWSDHISNTTTLSIILRLQEHAVHFPNRFGNYELVEWNAQPQKKLTRWQQHNKAVGFGIIIAVLLVLSNMVIWLVRRQRVAAPYLPVDAIASAPDQELQPLRT